MSSMNRPVTRSLYVMVLRKGLPSPLAPESDEEKGPDSKPNDKEKKDSKEPKKEPEEVRIDVDRIGQRILALPVPARNYTALAAGQEGVLFFTESPLLGPGSQTLQRF